MTLGKMLSNFGFGKQASERFTDYHHSPPIHEHHLHYSYDTHPHAATPKHGHYGGKKNHAAMSALTLLAFLFFLHILQQCLKDHMQSMTTPQIMIMSATREGDAKLEKSSDSKIDKSGATETDYEDQDENERDSNAQRIAIKNKIDENYIDRLDKEMTKKENVLTKVQTAQHIPKHPVSHQQSNFDF